MSLPYIQLNKVEGARPVGSAASKALIIGPANSGVKETTLYTFSSPSQVNTSIGYGNAALAAQLFLATAPAGFGSVDVLVSSGSGESITQVGSVASPVISVGGTPVADFDVRVEVTKAGITGSMKFKYSLDGGNTYTSDILSTGSLSGSYTIPNTGISATFALGSHAIGNAAAFDCQGPVMSTTHLAACINTLSNSNTNYTLILVADSNPNPATAVTLFSAMDGHLTTLQNTYKKFTQVVVPAGGETIKFNRAHNLKAGTYTTTNVLSSFVPVATSTGNFIAAVAERANTYIGVPQPGYARPRLPFAFAVAAQAHAVGSDISKNIAQDSVPRVETPSYDEQQNGSVYNDEKIIAPRTFIGEPNIFINQALIKSAPTSGYDLFPKARVVSVAASTGYLALRPWLHSRLRTLTDGTGRVDPRDKTVLETSINKALRAALLTPLNGQGFLGHCTDVRFYLNGENNLLSTGDLEGTILIVPFAYPDSITVNISLTDFIPAQ